MRRGSPFSIDVNWLLAIGLGALGLILLFIFKEPWRPVLLFVAPVLGGSAALIAAFNALETRGVQAEQSKKLAEQAKKSLALEFVLRWLDPALFHAKKNGREIVRYIRDNPSLESQRNFLSDPTLLANFIDVLNIFETMSIAIQCDLADEELLRRSYQSLVIEYWHAAEGFIKARRSERHNARILQEVEWLFHRWKN